MVDAAQSSFGSRAPRLPVFATAGRVFRMFATAPALFIGLSFIVALPGYLRLAFEGLAAARKFGTSSIVVLVVYFLMVYFVQTAVTYAAIQRSEGTPGSLSESLSVAARRYLPILGVSLLAMLIVYGGMLLLIVPGLIAACALAVIVPVCTMEERGPVECLRRSAALTKGARWRIFGIYMLFFLPLIAFSIANAFLILRAGHLTAYVILSQVFTLIWTPLSILLGAAIYVELRRLKETVGVASVFD